jgi:transglutaminase-like putative cysteine protease
MSHSTKIEPLLQIAVAALVVLGTFLLGMGQQNLMFPLLAVVAAVSSVILVDYKQLFRLRHFSSGLIGLASCVWLIVQIIRDTQQSQLLNVANALIFLQIILLFQRKHDRVYWQLITLSLLQVIVAAALNLGFLFGLMLCIYIAAAILALALFTVHRELRSIPTDQGSATANRFHWQPIENSTAFVLSRSFLGRLAWMATFTVLGTILFFFAIPRYSSRVWQPQEQQIRTVGYDDEIELDNISKILENPEQVMRVEFTRLDRTPFYFDDEPYFRGSVVDKYRADSGKWKSVQLAEGSVSLNRIGSPDLADVVLQKITLQPGEHAVLFNVSPCFASPDEPRELFLKKHSRQLSLGQERQSHKSPLRFQLLTDAFQNGLQNRWIPALEPLGPVDQEDIDDQHFFDYELETLISPWGRLYNERIERLGLIKQTADNLVASEQLTGRSPYQIALALERHFLSSPGYKYSLQMSTRRNHSLDPIVDFITNHKTGHCEYFASALALMLRSQGIPARLVIGYKGGDFNGMGAYFTVRQLHAHAWVEAYVPENYIPAGVVPNDGRANGAWFRLDPTPVGGRGRLADARSPLMLKINEFFDYCQVLWDDYVLGLNSTRQQESIYRPIARITQQTVYYAFGKEIWQARWRLITRKWNEVISGRHFKRQSIILLCILTPLLYIMRDNIKKTFGPVYDRIAPRWQRSRRKRADFAIYDRLENVLRRYGYRRTDDQTHREFALATGDAIMATSSTAGNITSVLSLIVDAFYRVRFGGESLPDRERMNLEESLVRIEKVLVETRSK